MAKRKEIELLAPAKSADIGIEAIRHGADAVYIGAPKFSARAAAGNDVADIERLTEFAHRYHARVYVALNTILYDHELEEAERMAYALYAVGADALIVQDPGVLLLNLPPIALHASTQMDTRTAAKAEQLGKLGFEQIVVARELNVAQIQEVCAATDAAIEVFVHGALCSSVSGQCYISQAFAGRSANRGECAQYCRLPFDLLDADGRVLERSRHLLSPKDLNRSKLLEPLLDAGVRSFKIEGRLKDVTYVKNITAYYRQQLDAIFERRPEYVAASHGRTTHSFTPRPEKSFNRGFTTLQDNKETLSPLTPKSIGEPIGRVKEIRRNSFSVATLTPLNNNDGLCFFTPEGELQGIKVNTVDGNTVFPARMPVISPKTELYRNYDHAFETQLAVPHSADRRISVRLALREYAEGFVLSMADGYGVRVECAFPAPKEPAQRAQEENIIRQLSRLGDTEFAVAEVNVELSSDLFIPSSSLSEWRREVVTKMSAARRIAFRPRSLRNRAEMNIEALSPLTAEARLSYRANVANAKARELYVRAGYQEVAPAFEIAPPDDAVLMYSVHCLRRHQGECPKEKKGVQALHPTASPHYYLQSKNTMLAVSFDCRNCVMTLKKSAK